jgi:tetratricopeptide (TPR) repeat protein
MSPHALLHVVFLLCAAALIAPGTGHAQSASVPPVDTAGFPAPVQTALADARAALEQAMQDPAAVNELAGAWGHYGDLLFVHELLGQARTAYARARALQPDDQAWPYLQALVELSANDPIAAAGFLDEVLALAPDDVPALLRRGRIRLEAGDTERAARDFARAFALAPSAPAALGGLGRVALATERYQEAAERLEQALALDPAASQLHHSLGMAYRGLGDIERARYHLELRGNRPEVIDDPLLDAVRGKSRSPQFYVEMGLELAAAGRLEEAARAMQRAVQLDPDHRAALLNAGELLARLGEDAGARALFERLAALDPGDARAWFYLGQLDELQAMPDVAVEHYRRSLTADPAQADARLALGDLFFSRGDFGAAAAEYEQLWNGAGSTQDRPLYGLLLGASYTAGGDCERALAVAEPALAEAAAPPAELVAMVVRLRTTCGGADAARRQAAVELAERLYEQLPGGESAETLAMAYAATGRFADAVELQMQAIFEALKTGDLPQRPDLRRNLERYEREEPAAAAYAPEHPLFRARKLAP